MELAQKKAAKEKIEMSRGQIPIVDEDFFTIPEVITSPDKVTGIGKDKLGRETVVFEKLMKDGNVIIYEAVLTGKKELAFQTLFKKKTGEFVLK